MLNDNGSAKLASAQTPNDLSEAEFLTREVADAKSELQAALAGMQAGLASSADLRAWVKRYPWAAIGTAVVAGFAAGAAVAPPTADAASGKASRAGETGQPDSAESPATSPAAAHEKSSVISDRLVSSFFDLAKIAIQTAIMATLRPPSANQDQDTSSSDSWQTRVAK